MMKNKTLVKIITLALSCLLLIGAAFGIASFADGETTLTIKHKNLSYEGAIRVLYTVDAENLPDDAVIKMNFYDTSNGAVPYFTAEADEKEITIGDKSYKVFFSDGIAPKNMRKTVYAKAVAFNKGGEQIAESEVTEYSIWQYATNRFENSPSPDQIKLYAAMLNYGASVQKMLFEAGRLNSEELAAIGGWANEYCGIKTATVLKGSIVSETEVKYYAPNTEFAPDVTKFTDTAAFLNFTSELGEEIGIYGASFKAEKPGITTINANYYPSKANVFDYCYSELGDVNALYSSKTMNAALGFNSDNFGTSSIETAKTSIEKDGDNYYFLGEANGTRGGLTSRFMLDALIGGDAYVFETDMRWDGYGDDVTSDIDAAYLRLYSNGDTDAATLTNICIRDGQAGSEYFKIGIYRLDKYIAIKKGEWFNIRIVVTPLSDTQIRTDLYLNNVLEQTLTGDVYSSTAPTEFYNGAILYTRNQDANSLSLSYALDNTVIDVITLENDYYCKGRDAANAENYDDRTTVGIGEGKLLATASARITRNDMTAISDYAALTSVGSGKALAIGKNVGAGWAYLTLANNNPFAGKAATHVFETDLKIGDYDKGTVPSNDTWVHTFKLMHDYATDTNFASLYLTYSSLGRLNLAMGGTKLASLSPEVWYNLRVEYDIAQTLVEENIYHIVRVYLNGELISTLNYVKDKDAAGTRDDFHSVYSEFRGAAKHAALTLDNTYMGTIGDTSNARVEKTVYDFENDDLTYGGNIYNIAGTTIGGTYSATGGGYAALKEENGNKYLEFGRGSGKSEIKLGTKFADYTGFADEFNISFDIRIEDIKYKEGTTATNTWPVRLRLGGSDDTAAFSYITFNVYYIDGVPSSFGTSSVKRELHANGDGTYSSDWINVNISLRDIGKATYGGTTAVVHFDGTAIGSFNAHNKYTGNAYNFPFISFETRGTTYYNTVRYSLDNIALTAVTESDVGVGEKFNDETAVGTKYDYEGLTEISTDNVLAAITNPEKVFADNGTFMLSAANPTNRFGIKNENVTTGNVHVIETDFILESGKSESKTENIAWFGIGETDNLKANYFMPLYLYANTMDADNNILSYKITLNETTLTTLAVGQWYNLRFVYTANNTTDENGATVYGGTVEMYVNGTLVNTANTVGFTESKDPDSEPNTKFEQFSFEFRGTSYSKASNIVVRIDNTYLGTIAQ